MLKFQTGSSRSATTQATTHCNPILIRRRRLLPLGISALLAFFITACSGGGSDPVIVTDSPTSHPTGNLVVQPSAFSLSEGETLSFSATLGSASIGASQLTWSVSPSGSATIANNGILLALKHGDVTVTARYASIVATAQGIVKAIPHTVKATSTTSLAGIVGRSLTDSVGVTALSTDGIPVPGVDIAFQVLSGEGSVSHGVKATGPDGVARVDWALGTEAGGQEIKASAGPLGEISFNADALPDYDSSTVVLVAGDEQEGTVATFLPEALKAQVTDQYGNPLPGLAVEWSFPGGGGASGSSGDPEASASRVKATTDAQGFSEMTWRLGTTAGDQEASLELPSGASASSGNMGAPQAASWWRNLIARWRARAKPAAPDAVQVSPEELWALVAEDQQLSASLEDAFGNAILGGVFSWRADNSGVVEVDNFGKVRGLKAGRAVVFAETSTYNLTGSAWVNIAAKVASAMLSTAGDGQVGPVGAPLPSPVSVQVLDQVGAPVQGTEVRWSVMQGSSTVGGHGTSPDLAPGQTGAGTSVTDVNGIAQTTWTLGTNTGGQTLQAQVDGVPPVEFTANAVPGTVVVVEVSPSAIEIGTSQAYQLNATGRDAFGNPATAVSFNWSSSDPSVATVGSDGIVTGIGEGSAQILATLDEGVGSATVTVTRGGPEVVQLLGGNDQAGTAGAALPLPLRVAVLDGNGVPLQGVSVSWSVATGGGQLTDASTLTDGNGIAETLWTLGPGTGQQLVQASVELLEPVSFTASSAAGPVARLSVLPSSVTVQVGGTLQLSASTADAYGNPIPDAAIQWSSSRTSVATADTDGRVFGVSAGAATITAACDGVQAFAQVTVGSDQGGEVFEKDGGDGQSGVVGSILTQPLRVRVVDGLGTPIAGREVTWQAVTGGGSISPGSGVTDSEGISEATWTLGTQPGGNGASAGAEGHAPVVFGATALTGPVAVISVTPSSATAVVGGSRQFTASAVDGYGNAVSGASMTWSSSNGAVASVGSDGLATGVGAGSAQIRATAGGKTGSAPLTVTAPPQVTNPGTVTNLEVVSVTDASATLRWTEVDDGTGQPAKYDVRYADSPIGWGWGPATVVTQGSCATPVQGQAVGQPITCTVEGLSASHAYDFQLVAYRGVFGGNISFGGLSNPATGTTSSGGGTTPQVATVTATPSSVSFTAPGETAQLTATVFDQYGAVMSGASISWSSTNTAVATVNSSGTVTAIAAGSVQVRATSGGKTGTATVTVSANNGGGGTPSGAWYNENWDYSSISALKQSVAYAFENNGSLSLLKGEQTPYGTINALKATVNGGYSTVGANLYPTQSAVDRPREVWFEVLVKFDSNWRTATVPEQSADHKTIFYTETGEVNRWAIHIGVFGGAVQGRINSGFAKQIRPDLDLPTWIWDGTWHRLRWHLKMGNGDGVFEMWLDEVKYLAETGINTVSGSRYFDVIALGRNGGFAEAASMYWGPVNVYISNPGW